MRDIFLWQNTNKTFIRSSIYMNKVSNRCMREFELQEEECLKDILFVDGNEADCDEDKNTLIEQVMEAT